MIRSYTGRKSFRKSFGHIKESGVLTDLIALQKSSYELFLQKSIPANERENTGLMEVFNTFFPVKDPAGKAQLEFCGYSFDEPKYSEKECHQKGRTYAAALRGRFRLVVWDVDTDTDSRTIRDIKEQDVYLGDFPLMTDRGTFIFNGIERVVVSQMHRSPGVFFDHDHGKTHSSGKFLYAARIIPYRGSWIDFEFDHRDVLYVRLDRKKKVLATTFLMCLESKETEEYRKKLKKGEEIDPKFVTGMSKEEILHTFCDIDVLKKQKDGWTIEFNKAHFKGVRLDRDMIDADTKKVVIESGTKITPRVLLQIEKKGVKNIFVTDDELLGRYIAEEHIDEKTGEIYIEAGEEINEKTLETIKNLKLKKISVVFSDGVNVGPYIVNTFAYSKCLNREQAFLELYKSLIPGEPPSIAGGEYLFNSMMFDSDRYDLSVVGRAKLNDRLGLDTPDSIRVLEKKDLVEVLKLLIALKDGNGETDDIDNLGNRRIRSVGELVENQCRLGMFRMERTIKEKIATVDIDNYVPSDFINSKPLMTVVKDFFITSQLSQFMDQTNPLSEVTHKRRLSALGPGGISRDRAGFEVRDVHPTHYSRLCPIETPEGQNIGLINSLASYAKINKYGFIEAPYKKVVDCRVTDEVVYMTATEEYKYSIGQANIVTDEKGNILEDMVICRCQGEVVRKSKNEIGYVEVSPKQVVSVAASLIPFLENDDASRALMGSNMQRQAVPLLIPEAPLVGTGMEAVIAKDSGSSVVAKRGGIVNHVDARRIVIRVTEDGETGVDLYNLLKFQCSNMGTCINQKPLVKTGDKIEAGDIIADGPSTDKGELGLGRNMLVAFMSWQGYSFEDSIVMSEKVVKNDELTSIHIESFEVLARDTKLGNEEITRDIPNIADESLRNLDESGIIYVGSEVNPGDILVGKVTPKGETAMTPEEKLLKAIFGEKSSDVKDSSFRVPPGISGTVVEVRVLIRRGVEKDERTIAIEHQEIDNLAKDRDDEIRILESTYLTHIKEILVGEMVTKELYGVKEEVTLTSDMLEKLSYYQIRQLNAKKKKSCTAIKDLEMQFNDKVTKIEKNFEDNVARLHKGDDLPAGVLKMVKVFVANKRKIQPGDKMAGRHGNKGVVSRILPIEDMPYLNDGTPVDIILNPLGLPSRMNVGQILETHLGAAAKDLGKVVQKALEDYRKNSKGLANLKDTVISIYSSEEDKQDIKDLNNEDFIELAQNLSHGIPVSSPVFEGAKLEEIENELEKAGIDRSGQVILYDGRTGIPFDRKVTVGVKYMLKLHHLVDDKIHARSVGPYSLITQQPLGGKAQFGGQRFGEMEVWALEAYGASHILREMLTVKSDDVSGRSKVYESIVRGENEIEPERPESFNVLVKELRSLGLSMTFGHKNGNKEITDDE
ncbi:MAG: DNA-directed RNA polymerase subunit beta [Holosporales bacterium]|jgi:DNA-directed RNA polymerase subunit beta|nr:DNA-directed RNA polymerase subunit beta [Holosporales bacterium]